MIKYLNIENYKNIGEIGMFSHIYQFVEQNKESPMVILVNTYDGNNNIFKGYLFLESKTFSGVKLTEYEKNKIEEYTGELDEISFDKLINNTIYKEEFKDFTENNYSLTS